MSKSFQTGKILAISGGIGGAKLALGLQQSLNADDLTVIVNTGDDFEHFGLYISPDMDTLLYTLADVQNIEQGWGRRDESWNFAAACENLGMDTWFQLGDRDLATHLYRTTQLAAGQSLSQVLVDLSEKFGIAIKLVPMSDQPVRTTLTTDIGILAFQEYFVKNRCEPAVSNISFKGLESAQIAPAFLQALADPELTAIVFCPSNPFLSIQPVLSLPGLKNKLKQSGKRVIIVSPIIDGQALKGPTAKLMQELNLPCNVLTIAEIYQDIASDIIIDSADAGLSKQVAKLGMTVHCTDIMMNNLEDKKRLAGQVLQIATRQH